MKLLFLVSIGLIFFAYAGYPACLYFCAKFRPRSVRRFSILPRVTIVMAVHNEEKHLPRKLRNLASLNYPADLLEIIVVSDGSTDQTNRILSAWQNAGAQAVILAEHAGKANALNLGVAKAHGEIICFTDARQIISLDGLSHLVANFADPAVGCASGALTIRDKHASPTAGGVGLYWRFEKEIRTWEGLAGSTVGATGAFYAVRKSLLLPLPIGTILDDMYIPLQVARQGSRVIFDPQAGAWDDFAPDPEQEFRRKVRTLAGNYQLLQLAPWLLTRSNPLRFQFVCHKVLRLFVPFALFGAFVSSLWFQTGVYELVLGLQLIVYWFAVLNMLRPNIRILSRLSNISLAFVLLNAAALVAFIYVVTRKKILWV